MAIKRIDHVAIVVDNIDNALSFWRDALGLDMTHLEEVKEQESIVAFLPAAQSEVELVKPTTETSGVAKYLAKRGPGMHHICFEVDDIRQALTALAAQGMELIDKEPRTSADGKLYAFVHPKSTGGVLIELYQLP
ncbi:MAG TPA: methylmalonyl-CoA epimerase [Anaerolineae bacterium]